MVSSFDFIQFRQLSLSLLNLSKVYRKILGSVWTGLKFQNFGLGDGES
jgi:hypothetical protein